MESAKATKHNRVRESSGESLNSEVDQKILQKIKEHGYRSKTEIDSRIEELNQE